MSLDIDSLVKQAFGIAEQQTPAAVPTITLRLGPTPTVDPETDQATTAWAQTLSVKSIGYADQTERERSDVQGIKRSFAVPTASIPDLALADETAEVDEAGTTWHVYETAIDPSGSLLIMHARR